MKTDNVLSESLVRRCLGNLGLAHRILNAFVTQTQEDLALLEEQLASEHIAELAKTAHRIKGAAANAGVESIRALAERLESSSRQADADAIAQELSQLQSTWQDVHQAVDALATD